MRMSVYSPVGKFSSVDFPENQKDELFKLITQRLEYVNFETDSGTIIIKGEALKNSVILFEED